MDSPDWLGDIEIPERDPFLSLLAKSNTLRLETILGVLLHFHEHGGLNIREKELLVKLEEFSEKPFSYIFLIALKKGTPLEKLAKLMTWSEFEQVTGMIFEEAGWNSVSNLRYFGEGISSKERNRFEIDLMAYKRPYILLIDNKRHAKSSPGVTKNWVERQQNRTFELFEQLPLIHDSKEFSWLSNWNEALLIPMIITWRDILITENDGTPIVSSKSLLDLLQNFTAYFVDSEWFHLKWEAIK